MRKTKLKENKSYKSNNNMAKSSGTTRASTTSSPRGLTITPNGLSGLRSEGGAQVLAKALRENGLLMGVDIPDRAREDFDRYSGTRTQNAIDFLDRVVSEAGLEGRAQLFYSGYSGWTLYDKDENQIGHLMYDGNKYGLEDATRGRGWEFRPGRGVATRDMIEKRNRIRSVVARLARNIDVPPPVRM